MAFRRFDRRSMNRWVQDTHKKNKVVQMTMKYYKNEVHRRTKYTFPGLISAAWSVDSLTSDALHYFFWPMIATTEADASTREL